MDLTVSLSASYAFSNLDDVCTPVTVSASLQPHVHLQISWGTKQDTTIDIDLGAVIQDSHSQVDVEMLAEAADANELYEDALQNLKHRMPVSRGNATVSIAEKEQVAKDYYASVRTNVRASSSSTSLVFL